jgi:hypothetical protein
MSESSNVTVFEAINFIRKERFIGATTLKMNDLISLFRSAAPLEARSWLSNEVVEYRSLEFGLDAAGAAAFIGRYAATQKGWKIITTDRILGS